MMPPSTEQMRVAIAEVCGCERYVRPSDGKVFLCSERPKGHWTVTTTRPVDIIYADVPNYPASLDACAEFEAWLDKDEVLAAKYADILCGMCHGNAFMSISAKPEMRCTAFLSVTRPEMGKE